MEQRINYAQLGAQGMRVMLGLERYVHASGLEHSLLHLVKVRASQINGCAYCVDMHTKDARLQGETEQRLYATSVWRDTPFFNERERAALAWTEALTLVSQVGVPDELYATARAQFSEQELVDLTFAVVSINAFNRLAIPFHPPVGTYQAGSAAAMLAGAT